MKMYEQMFNNINRHIMITWEVVPVVGGALGAVALSATTNVSVQVAGTIVVLLAAWLCAHALDSNEWVKRNLFIISNIERQFLESDDAQSIHFPASQDEKEADGLHRKFSRHGMIISVGKGDHRVECASSKNHLTAPRLAATTKRQLLEQQCTSCSVRGAGLDHMLVLGNRQVRRPECRDSDI